MSRWGVYVHVPWCRVICPYCAFAVIRDRARPDRPAAFDAWADGIARELALRRPEFPGEAETVYLGGGTPSRLPIPVIARVVGLFPRIADAEVTAEVNPEDVSDGWLADLVAAGVNRVSMGVQSFQPRHLARLRRPSPVDALRAVSSAGLRSWSADLIFGLPDGTLEELDDDLDRLLAADPPHVSVYGLTIEEGTPFAREAARGRLQPADDDLWRAMYDRLVERLGAAGLERYEVSNFARPGHESRHNQGYWQDRPCLALGPSAHGLAPDGARWVNHAELDTWLAAADPTAEREPPDPDRQARDHLISGLRAREGVDLDALAGRFGRAPDSAAVDRLVKAGFLDHTGGRVRLVGEGWPLADAVVARVIDALRPTSG
ncbi:MAG: coproporphyrinogen III oxidase family protein [Deltaproteobacteria bacterium]|nr:coproporphyrinogen III oxidase family protein [Deltaproteobacteria bacterium]